MNEAAEHKLKIVFITARAGFPNGFGSTSILRKYAGGFKKLGFQSDVLLLRPSESSHVHALNVDYKGSFEDIYFEYMCRTTYLIHGKFRKLSFYLYAIFRTLNYLRINSSQIYRVYFYSPDYFFSTWLVGFYCRLRKLPLIAIKTESSLCDTQRMRNPLWRLKERFIYNVFKTIFVITDYLKKQLVQFGYSGKVKVLPITVDENMFDNIELFPKTRSLVYMGTLEYEKELRNVIDIYSTVHSKYPEWKLIVIGGFISSALEMSIRQYAENSGVGEFIEWTGAIPTSDVPYHIAQCGIMILPRENKEYSRAGFPIKLGEYMLSGAPVVVTNTGEISKYLDASSIFLVDSDDPSVFAAKVIDIINNYQSALNIAKCGQFQAKRLFGSKNICKVMLDETGTHEQKDTYLLRKSE